MVNIKEKIKNAHYHKFTGVAPDGFTIIPFDVLQKLKDPDIWKKWIEDEKVLEKMIIDYCNNL